MEIGSPIAFTFVLYKVIEQNKAKRKKLPSELVTDG